MGDKGGGVDTDEEHSEEECGEKGNCCCSSVGLEILQVVMDSSQNFLRLKSEVTIELETASLRPVVTVHMTQSGSGQVVLPM